jgi:predicted glycoside hydrolase/deacetylase ChbG (UPF0249 family)
MGDGRVQSGNDGRRVVFHADDFGMSRFVTDGIFQGFAQGLLTSTSLMANAPDAGRALDRWKRLEHDRCEGCLPSLALRRRLDDPQRPFDLGIHLNLTQGRPLTGEQYPAELLDPQGRFPDIFGLFGRLRHGGRKFAQAIEQELARQIEFMLDHGRMPSHLNGHQYVEMLPAAVPAVRSLIERFKITAVRVALETAWLPAVLWPRVGTTRWLVAGVQTLYARRFRSRLAGLALSYPDAYFGTMTAGHTDLRQLRAFLSPVRRFQVAEIAVHPACPPPKDWSPGSDPPDGWSDPLLMFRPKELELMLSDELAGHLQQLGFRLGRIGPSPS